MNFEFQNVWFNSLKTTLILFVTATTYLNLPVTIAQAKQVGGDPVILPLEQEIQRLRKELDSKNEKTLSQTEAQEFSRHYKYSLNELWAQIVKQNASPRARRLFNELVIDASMGFVQANVSGRIVRTRLLSGGETLALTIGEGNNNWPYYARAINALIQLQDLYFQPNGDTPYALDTACGKDDNIESYLGTGFPNFDTVARWAENMLVVTLKDLQAVELLILETPFKTEDENIRNKLKHYYNRFVHGLGCNTPKYFYMDGPLLPQPRLFSPPTGVLFAAEMPGQSTYNGLIREERRIFLKHNPYLVPLFQSRDRAVEGR